MHTFVNHAILFPTSRKGNEQLKLDKTKGQHMYIKIYRMIFKLFL